MATLQTIVMTSVLAEKRTAATAMMDYQKYALDGAALRKEIAVKDSRSPLLRLLRAARRHAAVLDHATEFQSDRAEWYRYLTKWYFGTLLILYAMGQLLRYERSFTRLVSDFFTQVINIISF